MDIHELVIEMKLLERRLTLYEEKFGMMTFLTLETQNWLQHSLITNTYLLI